MRKPSEKLFDSITKDNLWIYILKILLKGNYHPYVIREKIEKNFGFRPGKVTSYIVLKRLENEGYVKIVKREAISGPERIYYKITQKGKEEIKKAEDILRYWYRKIKSF